MKITTITVTRTMQVRQYEPLVLGVSAELGEADDPLGVYFELLELVRDSLYAASGRMRQDLAPPRPNNAALPFA